MAPAPLGVGMARLASGTTWTPDAVTLPSLSRMSGNWELMLHGFGFVQYDKQGGTRGRSQFGSLNWAMVMATRELWGGRFQARTMLSLDPLTIPDGSYPLLLQSGEQYKGAAITDGQHPHDAFMEAALMYERQLSKSVGFSAYVAPSGEPALAPVAFMHRPSAMDNPFAPLGHHWQDATHITFGVATVGLFGNKWKLEASTFNAREPDDQRWNFDLRDLKSYSTRLTLNPNAEWSFTGGFGYLVSPEASHPDENAHRFAASAIHGKRLASGGQWSSSLVWGANGHGGGDHLTHAVLAETEAVLNDRHTVLGRVELAQKSGHDLNIAGVDEDALFNVSAASFGYIREVAKGKRATFGIGAVGTVNLVPSALKASYGSRTPLGVMIFVRLRPAFSAGHSMSGMVHSEDPGNARK